MTFSIPNPFAIPGLRRCRTSNVSEFVFVALSVGVETSSPMLKSSPRGCTPPALSYGACPAKFTGSATSALIGAPAAATRPMEKEKPDVGRRSEARQSSRGATNRTSSLKKGSLRPPSRARSLPLRPTGRKTWAFEFRCLKSALLSVRGKIKIVQ